MVKKLEVYIGEFTVACSFRSLEDNFLWASAGVCGPDLDSDGSFLWDELAGIQSYWNVLWCLGGDFNVLRFPNERFRDSRLHKAMTDFSDFISVEFDGFYPSWVELLCGLDWTDS